MSQRMSLGISPCPNDTYIFHALLHGLVNVPFEIDLVMADVEELNAKALAGELEFTKLSVGVVPHIVDKYVLLQSGAALGWGCGPLVVSRSPLDSEEQHNARIAIPGCMTTANLLLELHGGFQGPRQEMVFDQVIPAVVEGQVDAGVIIHEGRFTYGNYGLHKLLDLGAWWEGSFHMPLPLGAIAARRDVDRQSALALEQAISASILYARSNPEASAQFIVQHAQEMATDVTAAHIATFVNDYSVSLGGQGRSAIQLLLQKAAFTQESEANTPLFLSA